MHQKVASFNAGTNVQTFREENTQGVISIPDLLRNVSSGYLSISNPSVLKNCSDLGNYYKVIIGGAILKYCGIYQSSNPKSALIGTLRRLYCGAVGDFNSRSFKDTLYNIKEVQGNKTTGYPCDIITLNTDGRSAEEAYNNPSAFLKHTYFSIDNFSGIDKTLTQRYAQCCQNGMLDIEYDTVY